MINHGTYLTIITHGAEGKAGDSEERLLLELEEARGCAVGFQIILPAFLLCVFIMKSSIGC